MVLVRDVIKCDVRMTNVTSLSATCTGTRFLATKEGAANLLASAHLQCTCTANQFFRYHRDLSLMAQNLSAVKMGALDLKNSLRYHSDVWQLTTLVLLQLLEFWRNLRVQTFQVLCSSFRLNCSLCQFKKTGQLRTYTRHIRQTSTKPVVIKYGWVNLHKKRPAWI